MIKKKILELFEGNDFIEFYGYCYGQRYCVVVRCDDDGIHERIEEDKIVKFKIDKESVEEDGILYVCGGPGPDGRIFFRYDEYGKTWALTEEEIRR